MTKILVIEDELPLLEELVDILQFEDFEVLVATNGLEGLEQVQQQMPDLIISDIMMPKLDGYGVLMELQADSDTAMIPFIFLTARTDKQDMRKGIELGADDYLTKPFTHQELLAAVRMRLQKQTAIQDKTQQSLDELRRMIIHSMPHELRTPLNGIIGYGQLMEMESETLRPDEIAKMGHVVYNAGKRLHRLIESYLIYAQIEILSSDLQQVIALQRMYVEQPGPIIEASALQAAAQWQREVDLVLEIADNSPTAISEDNLKKIIQELMDNAFKFSADSTPVYLTTAVNEDAFCIHIRDHGRGMSRGQIQKIGAYMQCDRQLYEQQGGGFGLVIAKRLIELHNGKLDIKSEQNQGTQLTIILPFYRNEPSIATSLQVAS